MPPYETYWEWDYLHVVKLQCTLSNIFSVDVRMYETFIVGQTAGEIIRNSWSLSQSLLTGKIWPLELYEYHPLGVVQSWKTKKDLRYIHTLVKLWPSRQRCCNCDIITVTEGQIDYWRGTPKLLTDFPPVCNSCTCMYNQFTSTMKRGVYQTPWWEPFPRDTRKNW